MCAKTLPFSKVFSQVFFKKLAGVGAEPRKKLGYQLIINYTPNKAQSQASGSASVLKYSSKTDATTFDAFAPTSPASRIHEPTICGLS